MTNTGNASGGDTKSPKSTKPKLNWYWRLAGLVFFGFTIFYVLMPALDSVGIESIRCEISSAKSDTSSGGTRGSISTPGVLVETTNCGSIYVSSGVTFDNQDEVAASFKAGSEYEFDPGWFSRVMTKDIRQGIPSVQGYRLVK